MNELIYCREVTAMVHIDGESGPHIERRRLGVTSFMVSISVALIGSLNHITRPSDIISISKIENEKLKIAN